MFRNEPTLELRRPEVRAAAVHALSTLDARLPLAVGPSSGDGLTFTTLDPARPERVVAEVRAATGDQAAAAVARAADAHAAWAGRDGHDRASVLRRAAALLRARRLDLAALAVRECGKPWPDADGDVAEAIDFLEFYADAGAMLDEGPCLLAVPGERNTVRYVGRGVTAVIAPWNFPFAIAVGMTAAALAVGSTVVLKPAEQASACGREIVAVLREAGVPVDAVQLLPGGDEVGRALVVDPRVHAVAFTGSCAVGLEIVERAARMVPGQRHVKRVIAEMGGKNCIIVDADADLDEVVPGVLGSAFGFAGQKCSAASRVLVHEALAEPLVRRLAGAVESLRVGPAEEFATDVPPVIDRAAQQRIAGYVRAAGAPAATAPLPAGDGRPTTGYYVAPMVFVDPPPGAPLTTEEIFGPVLTVERVTSIAEACDLVDASAFALTGGVYSRRRETVAEVARRSPVGNLYVNRGTTGAMVSRQPFGGGQLSGTGPKAGTAEYVLRFAEARVVCESTVRHGLLV